MNTITIDCGASFVKGALFRDDKKIKVLQRKSPSCSCSPLKSVRQIVQIRELVRDLIVELSEDRAEYYLCISNEMHGFILADGRANPVVDYISWQNDLGDMNLRNSLDAAEFIKRSGMPLRGGLPSSNLSYLITGGFLKDYKELHFYTLGDYLIRYLSGINPTVSRSNAAATGLYDIVSDVWNDKLIDFIGADYIIFPNLSDEEICFDMSGCTYHTFPAIGDQQAALLGAGLKETDTLSFNLGTGAQVSRVSDKIELSDLWQVRPFFNNKYLITIPHIPSGRALNVFAGFVESILDTLGYEYTEESVWSGIVDSVKRQQTSNLKIDLGFFENAINSSTKGAVTNIDEHDLTMDNLFYAVVSQMADNFCTVADRIAVDRTGIRKLMFSGGIAQRFDSIRKCISDHFPDCEVLTAQGDTLEGLCNYCNMLISKTVKG